MSIHVQGYAADPIYGVKVESGWTLSEACLIYEACAGIAWVYAGQDDVAIWKECLEYTNLWFFAEKNPTDFSKPKPKALKQTYFTPTYNAVYLPKNISWALMSMNILRAKKRLN